MHQRRPKSLGPRPLLSGLGGEQNLRAEMMQIATSVGGNDTKAAALLNLLHHVVRYDAAWIAIRDPVTGRHTPVVQDGPTEALQAFYSTDEADAEMQRLGLDRFGWPTPAHLLPVPLEETLAWGKYLLPAGFRDGLAVSLFAPEGPHVGYLLLLTTESTAITATAAALLHAVNPLISAAVASMQTITR